MTIRTTWTSEQVEALSPDAASLKAARKLLNKAKWSALGRSDVAVWGQCQGSGKKPYLTRADLRSDIAFKCSCPSRKFPCKHALAMMLLLAQDASDFSESDAPDWVQEWLDARAERQEKKVAKAQEAAKPVDKAAQAKRIEAREKKVLAGLNELELWLHDTMRTGLMALSQRPYSYFDGIAARLVDAQAKGLANRVRALAHFSLSDPEQAQHALVQLGHLQLLIRSYRQQASLPAAVRADVRRAVGWTDDQKALAAQEGVVDRWLVLGQTLRYEDNLRVLQTWFWGRHSKQVALDLQFAFGERPFTTVWQLGTAFEAEAVFFPSNYPQRALFKKEESKEVDKEGARQITAISASELEQVCHYEDFASMLAAYGAALARHCWLEQFPIVLQTITPYVIDDALVLADGTGSSLPVALKDKQQWQLLALSGGYPLTLVATWDGQRLHILAAWQEERLTVWTS